MLSSISTTALSVEIREPNPRHVWEAADDLTSAGLGTPETDDVVLTLACAKNGKLDVMFADYAPMPDGKEGDGGPAGITLRRGGKEVSVRGTLLENLMTGGWDLSTQQPATHPLFDILKGDFIAEIEIDPQYQKPGGQRDWISLKGAKKVIEKVQARCSGATPPSGSTVSWNSGSQAQVASAPQASAAKAPTSSDFARYALADSYQGQVRLPDFKGRDRDWNSYRTRIREGMKGGANFAGRLAFIEIGCGAGCRWAAVADVSTGRVYNFPLGGEEYMYLDLHYRPNSRLVVAFWQNSDRCMKETLEWTGQTFRRQGAVDVGSEASCNQIQSQ
ncbi:hypothetical protein IC232_03305 [Microvirga sp. BT688]|uniref:hypothetical protein n=1 Tax=Microvirga sp. TaxID=1873136 RepID=UPI001684C637|nr:hypothetical protein [Microvirga sp.]MBD2745716.1 hypothetical protein [Microvirga sp.]